MVFFIPQFTIITELSFKNSILPQLTSALWSLFRLLPVKKEEIEAFFLTPLRNFQTRAAFTAPFTSEE
jgi:hypothetical protein